MGYINWNPWHGCTKISEGCLNCYVYRQDNMYGAPRSSSEAVRNAGFYLPLERTRGGAYRSPPGTVFYTCFTSDFLLKDADEWRKECWDMMKRRSDCFFCFFTKRISRLEGCLPNDWGDGYGNVMIGCTCENQKRADERLPIFCKIPIKHRSIICAPLLGKIELEKYLSEDIEEVSVGGESGNGARICDYGWVLDLRRQCIAKNVAFTFHQTGANFLKDGRLYRIPRKLQRRQAHKADIDTLTSAVEYRGTEDIFEPEQLTF